MNTCQSPTVFESFNAKNLLPSQVAKTFVPSDHFDKISKRNNSFVIGPRGSGKTTLFKMLELEALESWKNKEADRYRSLIDFTGIFIPTDRIWKEQIEYLLKDGFAPTDAEFFTKALFCSHVLYKLLQSIQYRCVSTQEAMVNGYKKVYLDKENEINLAIALSEAWHLDIKIPNIKSLMSALAIRKSEIPRIIEEEKRLGEINRSIRLAEKKFLSLNFIQSVATSLELFEIHSNIKEEKWALMFDELELAPTCIVQELVNALRGSNERILFKLSLAPYNPEINISKDLMSAMPGNDYEFVILWYAHKTKETRDFCEKMLQEMLKEKSIDVNTTPEDIFGKSELDGYDKILKEMITKDESFKIQMKDKGIDIQNIGSTEGTQRDSIIRKAIPIIRIRNEFLKSSSHKKQILRTRKTITPVYSGANALFDMLEANPRWFIGVINPLLDEYKKTGKQIDTFKQLDTLKKTIHKFRALLKTIPCPAKIVGEEEVGVDKLIDKIGTHFSECILATKFNLDPPGSFNVTKGLSPGVHKSLGAALNAGAIVYVNGASADIVLGDLTDHRFRLSYLLAPHYKIPLQLLSQTGLKGILDKGGDNRNMSLDIYLT